MSSLQGWLYILRHFVKECVQLIHNIVKAMCTCMSLVFYSSASAAAVGWHALDLLKLSNKSSSRTVESVSSLRCHDHWAFTPFSTFRRPCPKLASRNCERCADLWFLLKLQTSRKRKKKKKGVRISNLKINLKVCMWIWIWITTYSSARPSLFPPSPMVMYTGPQLFASLL